VVTEETSGQLVVGDGDWYDNNMTTMTATVTTTKIMTTTVGRGVAVAVLKIEPSVAAAVAMAGADNNQQRAAKTAAVAIAVIGAALEIFSRKSKKTSFGSTYARKIEAKKSHEAQFVPPPKLAISTFDDGGQYLPVIIIPRC
jgi:hypothetical protein